MDYDVLVIGSGPAGQKAAIAAAKLGRRVAIVERARSIGGGCVHTGTLPSKALREAALGLRCAAVPVTIGEVAARVLPALASEVEVVTDQLTRNHVRVLAGSARFVGPHELVVDRGASVTAAKIVIAVGSRPARPAHVDFDDTTVVDSDTLIGLRGIPDSLVVVGAGVIGLEYASMFATLGSRVTVVDERDRILEFCDREIVDALCYHLRDVGVTLRLGESVAEIGPGLDGAVAVLASGKRIAADTILYSAGRRGATDGLDLHRAGLAADRRGRLAVDEHYRTATAHIYAVGDVIGFPALAATSAEQGRIAGHHACGEPATGMSGVLPIGIYTVPEISYVGRTEEELTRAGIAYEAGVARYRELARGQLAGDRHGFLKILVAREDRSLLGVHVFGHGATELVHVGQVAMATSASVDYFVDAVFNYPTLAEAYKVAALDVSNRLRNGRKSGAPH